MDELTDAEVAMRVIAMYENVSMEDLQYPPSVMENGVRCIELAVQALFKSDEIKEPGMIAFGMQLGEIAENLKLAIENTSKTPTEKLHFERKKHLNAAQNQMAKMLGIKSKAGAKKENVPLILLKMAKLLCSKNDFVLPGKNRTEIDIVDHAAELVAKDMGISKRTVTRHWKNHKDFIKLPIWEKYPWFKNLPIKTAT